MSGKWSLSKVFELGIKEISNFKAHILSLFLKVSHNVRFSSTTVSLASLYFKAQFITDGTNAYKQSPFLGGNEV